MTGFDIFKKCLALLGYSHHESETVAGESLLSRMPHILNQIALDLKITPIEDLSTKINVDGAVLDALCNGCAMLLALSEGDGAKNQIFTAIYNSKRASVLSESYTKSDVLPAPLNGGD